MEILFHLAWEYGNTSHEAKKSAAVYSSAAIHGCLCDICAWRTHTHTLVCSCGCFERLLWERGTESGRWCRVQGSSLSPGFAVYTTLIKTRELGGLGPGPSNSQRRVLLWFFSLSLSPCLCVSTSLHSRLDYPPLEYNITLFMRSFFFLVAFLNNNTMPKA